MDVNFLRNWLNLMGDFRKMYPIITVFYKSDRRGVQVFFHNSVTESFVLVERMRSLRQARTKYSQYNGSRLKGIDVYPDQSQGQSQEVNLTLEYNFG